MSSSSGTPYRLARLVGGGFGGVFRNPGAFLTAAVLPWLLLTGLQVHFLQDLASGWQAGQTGGHNPTTVLRALRSNAATYGWLQFLAAMLLGVVTAVAWHRFLLGWGARRCCRAWAGGT